MILDVERRPDLTKIISKTRRALVRQLAEEMPLETVKAPLRPKWHLPMTDREGKSLDVGASIVTALKDYMLEKYCNRSNEVAHVVHQALSEKCRRSGRSRRPASDHNDICVD